MNRTKQKKKHNKNLSTTRELHHIDKDSQKIGTNFDNDSGHGDSEEATSTTISYPSPVELMTSKDFQHDTNAHIEMIHQMLKDSVRIDNYRAAILHNKHLFKGKCVLDIGCGVGIFSLFAAKAGAAKVFAVDTSNVVYYTRKVVAANGYEDVIEVLKGKIEDIHLPVQEVDIIISDWVGYALLFRSICDAVIYARDKWLKKPDGLIFPDQAKLFMVALEDGKHKNENIEWWKGVYGFNMKCLRDLALKEPRFQLIKPQQVLSKQCAIKSVDLYNITKEDLRFRSKYMLPIQRTGHMDGIALYFHVYFTKSHTPLGFSTDPWSAGTNWMQTILFLDQPLSVQANTTYYGGIEMFSAQSPPNLNDMTVNLELLWGDPAQPDVDVEMSWQLKPPTTPSEMNVPCEANGEEKAVNENIKTLHIPKMDNATESTSNVLVDQEFYISANAASYSIITPPNIVQTSKGSDATCNMTLTLGKHNYPCRKNKRNKNKHSKKG